MAGNSNRENVLNCVCNDFSIILLLYTDQLSIDLGWNENDNAKKEIILKVKKNWIIIKRIENKQWWEILFL